VRVTLERFVLGNILDSVLSIASQRLHLMSKGQYRLIRQNEEEQLKNTTAGLDFFY
jgi:exonuclease SbcC